MRVNCISFENGKPVSKVVETGNVIVEDRFGNPLMVATETQPGVQLICTIKDPEFHAVLKQLGFDRVVVVNTVADEPVPESYRPARLS